MSIITNIFETDNDLTEQLLTQHNNNFEYEKTNTFILSHCIDTWL